MKKVCLSQALAAASARLAAQRGFAVCVNYLRDHAAAVRVVGADVSLEADVVRLFETIDDSLGPVTALVNNAGINPLQGRVENMDAQRLTRVLAVNVTGSFLCVRQAVRQMSTNHGGSGGAIVNISSAAARLGSPGEYVDYAASKAAIDTFTLGLAKEIAAEGIRVNAVRPGVVYTNIHASGGEPEEIAQAVLWLLSDEASYCTGSILDVAGGR